MDFNFSTDSNKPEIQFYKNTKHYPIYSNSITAVGSPRAVTPRNIGMRDGYIDLQVDMADITGSNYIGITKDNFTLYAFIDRVDHVAGDSNYRFHYTVDPLRTYKDRLTLGNQFIKRSPTPTALYDEFLGSTDPNPEVFVYEKDLSVGTIESGRVLVVQVRSGEATSNTPGMASPYTLYFAKYFPISPLSSASIRNLIDAITYETAPYIITMYSIPDIDFSNMMSTYIRYRPQEDENDPNDGTISGFYRMLPENATYYENVTESFDINTPETPGYSSRLTRVDASISLVIPEAGVLDIPPEVWGVPNLKLRRDIDVYSGLANYALTVGDKLLPYSVRGGGNSHIPVIGDPLETYVSQNQNTLQASVGADVATIAGGLGAIALSPTTFGTSALVGAGAVVAGAKSLISTQASKKDAGRRHSNPPAFLGSALITHFSGKAYQVEKFSGVDNETIVHGEMGYPYNLMAPLTIPATGFIQTQGCSVRSDGTVPKWAVDEINGIFDRGLKVE